MNVMLNGCAILQQLMVFSLPCKVCVYFLNRHQRRIKINIATNIKCHLHRQECYNFVIDFHGKEYVHDPCVDISVTPVLDFSDATFTIEQNWTDLQLPVTVQFSFPLMEIDLNCSRLDTQSRNSNFVYHFKY